MELVEFIQIKKYHYGFQKEIFNLNKLKRKHLEEMYFFVDINMINIQKH